jgi:hypothetical protein
MSMVRTCDGNGESDVTLFVAERRANGTDTRPPTAPTAIAAPPNPPVKTVTTAAAPVPIRAPHTAASNQVRPDEGNQPEVIVSRCMPT